MISFQSGRVHVFTGDFSAIDQTAFNHFTVPRLQFTRQIYQSQFLGDNNLGSTAAEQHKGGVARLRAGLEENLCKTFRDLAWVAGLLAGDILDQVEVHPRIRHASFMPLRDPLFDADVLWVFVRLRYIVFIETVALGLGGVQDRAVRSSESARGMTDVCVVAPHIVVDLVSDFVQATHSQVGVLLGIVDKKHIAVWTQDSHALPRQRNVPLHIIVPRRCELVPIVRHADIVVRIAVNHIHAVVRQIAKDSHHIAVNDAVSIFFRE